MNLQYKGFRWEQDHFYWEKLRFDELGLPEAMNMIVPDKLLHFLATFLFVWAAAKAFKNKWIGFWVGWGFMMVPWEIIWDGMFRYGASWKDMVANTLGGLLCVYWLGKPKVGQDDSADKLS